MVVFRSWLLCACITLQYLCFLFFLPSFSFGRKPPRSRFPKEETNRNDSRVIQTRFLMQLCACLLGFFLVLWWLRETMSFEEVFAMVCTGRETKKNFLISSSKMFGILGVAMDVTTDLFFGLAVTGLVYLGPVVCAVFRSSAMMHQR